MEVLQMSKSPMLVPVATVEEARKVLEQFMVFKQTLLLASDKQTFKVKNRETDKWEEKEFCKKAGCQKLAMVFNISCDIVSEHVDHLPDGKIIARVEAKATHVPSGRYFTASAACSSEEKMTDEWKENPDTHKREKTGNRVLFNPARVEHDVLSHAQTRASNRAILSILGSGEISAEEMESDTKHDQTPEFCLCQGGPKTGIDGRCKTCNNFSKVWWENNHK